MNKELRNNRDNFRIYLVAVSVVVYMLITQFLRANSIIVIISSQLLVLIWLFYEFLLPESTHNKGASPEGAIKDIKKWRRYFLGFLIVIPISYWLPRSGIPCGYHCNPSHKDAFIWAILLLAVILYYKLLDQWHGYWAMVPALFILDYFYYTYWSVLAIPFVIGVLFHVFDKFIKPPGV